VPLEDHRTDRVAERGDEDRPGAEELVELARGVDADQRRHPDQTDQESDQAPAARPLAGVEAEGEQRDEQRRRRDQDRGQRRVDVLLADRDERERQRDLGGGEGEQPAQPAAQRGEHAGPPGQREQHRRAEHDADPGQEGGRHAAFEPDLDEEVRRAPQNGHHRESDPGARAHSGPRAAAPHGLRARVIRLL
jgi:hypothetical protein